MSNLKEQIMDVLNTAEELIAEAPQTIQVRGASKYLKQVQGSIASATFETLDEARAVLYPLVGTLPIEEVSEGTIETATDQSAEILKKAKDLLDESKK